MLVALRFASVSRRTHVGIAGKLVLDCACVAKTADQEEGWGGHKEEGGDGEGEVHAVYVPLVVNVWMVFPPTLVTVPPDPR